MIRASSLRFLTFFAMLPAAAASPAAPLDERPLRPSAAAEADKDSPGGNIWAVDPRLQTPEIDLAREALEAGNVQECLDQLGAAHQSDLLVPPPLLTLAYLHLAKGRLAEGYAALEQASMQHRDHPEIYYTAGRLAAAQGRHLDAWIHFEKALQMKPPGGWPDAYKQNFPLLCLAALADVAQRRRDWPAAEKVYSRWAKIDANDAEVHERWGEVLFLTGKSDDAFDKFAAAHRLEPDRNPAELSIAALHARLGEFDRAEQLYQKALKKYPDDGRVYFEFGGALLFAGRLKEAQAYIDKAVGVGTVGEEKRADLALLRGFLARSMKDYEGAERFFTEVLRASPGHFQALRQLPLVLVEQRDDDKRERAAQMATLLVQRYPQAPQALAAMGWVEHRLGRTAEAEQMLRNAAADGNIETLYFLGQVLMAQGKTDDAKEVVQMLQQQLSQPGLFIMRREAQRWVDDVSLVLK